MIRNQLIAGLVAACCYAQSFDVVSIRPTPDKPTFRLERLPGDHEVRATATLGNLIRAIYSVFEYTEPAGSSWVNQDWWDLDAKSEQSFTQSEMNAMLQNLLSERFKLKIIKDQRPGSVYVLTVAPQGPRFVKTESIGPSGMTLGVTPDGKFFLNATAITIAQFTYSQPLMELRTPVVDSTGLSGRYDIHWVLGYDPFNPFNLMDTCERQLGLKLAPTKGLVNVIKIVHVEKPTPN